MFRGYQQHDTQEFLRCFMDQLHEELKEPVINPHTPSALLQGKIIQLFNLSRKNPFFSETFLIVLGLY